MLAPYRMFILCTMLLLMWGCSAKGVRHVVLPGQTLYRISTTYGVSVDDIARYNHIRDTSRIKAGDSLWIPGVAQHKTVSIVPSTTSSLPPRSAPVPNRPISKPKPQKTVKRTSSSSQPARTTAAHRERFEWPVQGKVIKEFRSGNKKGIEIAVPAGTSVYSAAAGQVIYSSNDISGYGYLIIIRHSNDVYTVYGYNRKALVQAGAFVGKKEKIAVSGTPPGEQQGRLHFEVREGKTDVNPKLYLR
ncbi:MAG TPA: M23 family metallopeptidase [Pseudomonadales bacterium]|nr:M23 family metallopeptidase [Pseudomonadales bacterium]